ncbi:carbohydrate binding protein with CBM6 domain [Mucilaginibacter gracilis]|uniref:Carbohydrate binding protein with CBM6 domain n=1 Tax=Mucilaginibacter gracilis TaxID=423350 RepID=A0A495IYI4_9SPHI|nr:glycoside hydrolase family 43 protein [Mucilaginibacter gracilis]RKR81776.1 carbohydrate binding protein with CBM6 domain [Mucilaginibacter gracilis]
MKIKFFSIAFMLLSVICNAQNPIIQTKFTADPAPMVYHDTVFLYTSHDEDDAKGFKMLNWLLYTSTDMVNWTDRGSVASLKTFDYTAENGAWAPQCIPRNGKFYLYVPVARKGTSMGIGVAVSDSPYGPFKDAIGKPLIAGNSNGDFDPTVYIDDDGQAYLYWGNPNCYYVKLNPDMVSYSGDIVKIDSKPANYQEGPWFYKRNSHYYLAYASTCCPEGIGYAMSDHPTGPWVYKGMIMDGAPISSGNHPGIIDYKGNSYVFGFNYALNWKITNIHHERRSICVEKLTYNADGSIQKLPFWSTEGTEQIGKINPYQRVEAETIALSSGVQTAGDSQSGVYVTGIDNTDYIKVRGADFGSGAKSFTAAVASSTKGGYIEIHLDSPTGKLAGTCIVKNTGGDKNWANVSCDIKDTKGVHDIYLVFRGGEWHLFNFDWWKFTAK